MKHRIQKHRLLIGRLLLLVFLMLAWAVPASAYNIPSPTDDFYVNDTAGLLSQESYDTIMNVNVELQKKTKAQVVVATVESLEGADLESYATEMFRSYGIGGKDENNGILILLAYEERQLRIEVGYGLEGAINDAKAGRIMDTYMIPYLRDDLWDKGIVNGFNAVIYEICKEYNVELTYDRPVHYTSKNKSRSSGMDTETIIYIVIFVLVIIISFFSKGSGSSGGGSYRSYSGGSRGGYSGGGGSSGGGGASRGF